MTEIETVDMRSVGSSTKASVPTVLAVNLNTDVPCALNSVMALRTAGEYPVGGPEDQEGIDQEVNKTGIGKLVSTTGEMMTEEEETGKGPTSTTTTNGTTRNRMYYLRYIATRNLLIELMMYVICYLLFTTHRIG